MLQVSRHRNFNRRITIVIVQHINIGPGTDPKIARAAQFAAARAGTVAIDDDTGAIYAFDNRQVKALLIDKRLVGGARAIFGASAHRAEGRGYRSLPERCQRGTAQSAKRWGSIR